MPVERVSPDYRGVWKVLNGGDRLAAERCVKEVEAFAEAPARADAAKKAAAIYGWNRGGNAAYFQDPDAELGVSADTHVSHVLFARP